MVFPPDSDIIVPIDIENLDINTLLDYTENDKAMNFFYSKEEIAKLGFSLEELEALECFTLDNPNHTENNSILIDSSIIINSFILNNLQVTYDDSGVTDIIVNKMSYNSTYNYYIMRFAYGDNNNYIIMSGRPAA